MKTVNILIADDHELIRDGIKVRLEKQPGWRVCAEANDGRQAVKLAIQLKPDVVVMDIGMAELNGIEATRQIRKACPQIEVLILTLQESETLIGEVLAAGARGFILKTDAARFIKGAIEALLEHKTFFTGKVANLVLKGFLDPKAAFNPGLSASNRLTSREREIVQLLAEGKTSKEVATSLGVSIRTAEAHRANLLRKLNLDSVAELVRYAIRNKIIEL
jgi:DNA-binding NarL/FixJ family response regulator